MNHRFQFKVSVRLVSCSLLAFAFGCSSSEPQFDDPVPGAGGTVNTQTPAGAGGTSGLNAEGGTGASLPSGGATNEGNVTPVGLAGAPATPSGTDATGGASS